MDWVCRGDTRAPFSFGLGSFRRTILLDCFHFEKKRQRGGEKKKAQVHLIPSKDLERVTFIDAETGFNERSLDRSLAMRLVYNLSLPNKNTKKSVFFFPIYLKIRKMVEIIIIYFCKFPSPGFLYFYSWFLTGLPIGSP